LFLETFGIERRGGVRPQIIPAAGAAREATSSRLEPICLADDGRDRAFLAIDYLASKQELTTMTRREVSAGAATEPNRLARRPASLPDGDADLFEKLRAYLSFRSRNVDPPPALAEAWDHFYDIYTPRIRWFLSRSGLSEADREDCLQDVWSEVVTHLADLRYDPGRGRLSTWLLTVARNRALNMLRRRRRLSLALIEDGAFLVDPGPGPLAACECLSRKARVNSVLTELSGQVSELNFQVLYQRFIEGRTSAEVADALGLRPEQVRFRLHRMKQKFRDLFEQPAPPRPSRNEGGCRETVRKIEFSRNDSLLRVNKEYQEGSSRTSVQLV
jgi:RNA polymerase sigma factor (sigma-70 family)